MSLILYNNLQLIAHNVIRQFCYLYLSSKTGKMIYLISVVDFLKRKHFFRDKDFSLSWTLKYICFASIWLLYGKCKSKICLIWITGYIFFGYLEFTGCKFWQKCHIKHFKLSLIKTAGNYLSSIIVIFKVYYMFLFRFYFQTHRLRNANRNANICYNWCYYLQIGIASHKETTYHNLIFKMIITI